MVNLLYTPPVNLILSGLLLITAIGFLWRSIGKFMSAYQHAGKYCSSIFFIRGIRNLLLSLTAGVWAASLFWSIRWLFIIGLIIICQELYEGAILSTVLKRGEQLENKDMEGS
jgi:hypothetical protein